MGSVGLAFSGGGIRSATFNLGFLQGLASLGLLKQFDYLSTVSGGGYIGGWFAAWVRREGGLAGDPKPIDHADFKEQVAAKRRRTAQALENVELQLDSKRHVQSRADRRWVSSDEVRKGREAVTDPPTMLQRTVEEEPEPVYHLRAYSNYLAPKIGMLSIDTWTMVSVYLRNLLLNQFILLPMTLAAIAVPRLLLLLFASPTTEPMLTVTRHWLTEHDERRMLVLLGVATVAMLTALKLFDFCQPRLEIAWKTRRQERRPGDPDLDGAGPGGHGDRVRGGRRAGTLLHADHSVHAGTILVGFLALKPWVCDWAPLIPLALLAIFDPRRSGGLAPPTPKEIRRRERLDGWTILLLLVFGLAPSLRWPLLLGLTAVEPVTSWLTGDLVLFIATFVMALIGFHRTYRTVALIRESRMPATSRQADRDRAPDLPYPLLWEQILIPLTLASFGVSLLFSRPGTPYFLVPLPTVGDWFSPSYWGGHDLQAGSFCFRGDGRRDATAGLRRDRAEGVASQMATDRPGGSCRRGVDF